MHKCHMIIDLQFGSTGKGLLAGYLAKREGYDTAVCSFATNAGHTYIDKSRGLNVMTQQLPTGITSPTVRNVMIGPGALIHIPTLLGEMDRYADLLVGKRVLIHPHAGIVTEGHMFAEQSGGMSKIGSTTKGCGEAAIQKIRRNPESMNVAAMYEALGPWLTSAEEYRATLETAENVIVEGAQGFSLSMHHGFYPFCTSRDVTPWQIAADCGLPFKWASYIKVCGTMRTFPIRVNNRDGSSGPCYEDQVELSWSEIKNAPAPELTTVTKLPRRIFTFSDDQTTKSLWHCGGYWETQIFLNFANYLEHDEELQDLIRRIEAPDVLKGNPPKVAWIGFGPDDEDVVPRAELDGTN